MTLEEVRLSLYKTWTASGIFWIPNIKENK